MASFASIVAREGAGIREIHHDRAFASEDITTVTVRCILETQDHDHVARLRQRLAEEGFLVENGETGNPLGI